MMKKLLLSATLLLAASQLLSRGLGVVRDHFFAQTFGAIGGTGIWNIDTYYAAFRLPDLIYSLLVFGALSAAFVPLLAEHKDREAVNRFASNALNVILVGFLLVAGGIALAAEPLMHALVPGFSADEIALTATLLRIQLIGTLFFSINAVFTGLSQHFHRLVGLAFAPVVYNLGIIGGALLLAPTYGVYGLSVGVAIGGFLAAFVQLPSVLAGGWRYRAVFRPRELVAFFRLAGPRVFSVGASQLEWVVITFFASIIGSGALAVFNYAWNLASLPFGVIGVAYATAGFATLARLAKTPRQFAETLGANLAGVLFWAVPAAVGIYLLRTDVTQLVLAGGAFTERDADFVAESLGILALSIPFLSVLPTLNNAFFARKNTETPFIAGVLFLAITGFGSWLLIDRWETAGLAMAYATANILGTAWLWWRLAAEVPFSVERPLGRAFLALIAMCVVIAWPALGWEPDSFVELTVKLILVGGLGGVTYLGVGWLLGLDPRRFSTLTAPKTVE